MTGGGQVNIGPVGFRISGAGVSGEAYAHWPYADFTAPAFEVGLECEVTVLCGSRPCPAEPALFVSGRHWVVWDHGGRLTFCAGIEGRSTARWTAETSPDLTRVDLWIDEQDSRAPLVYPIDQILCWGLLGRCGGALLHAALVEHDGEGWLLSGRSGVGKSTLAGLCGDAGWTVLNDDRSVVFPRGATWFAAGTPWHGAGLHAANRVVPLRGLLLLEQGDREEIIPMERQAALRRLLDVTSVPWFLDSWSEATCSALEHLVSRQEVSRCVFRPVPEAVRVLEGKGVVAV
ncbi:MAG TPA: hypothetical protein PKE55_02295 [Kiritimatiellia bacterium]|nr:hypothetical protein [Kiritimatiellia bacterium]